MISEARMLELLAPYLDDTITFPPRTLEGALTQTSSRELCQKLASYLDLLLRWNARTNLTAIREPEAMVQRHFGESLFAGRWLSSHVRDGDELLDFGSGAGFPGAPIQLLYPRLRVTLAESQGKKAAFLRELTRTLGISAEVWAERVQTMPRSRQFSVVMLRAVDDSQEAKAQARTRVQEKGWLVEMGIASSGGSQEMPMPGLNAGVLRWEQIL